jgi:hypothetical protein
MKSSVKTFKNRSIEITGDSCDIMNAFTKLCNFKMEYKIYEDIEVAINLSDVIDLYGIASIQEYSDKSITIVIYTSLSWSVIATEVAYYRKQKKRSSSVFETNNSFLIFKQLFKQHFINFIFQSFDFCTFVVHL